MNTMRKLATIRKIEEIKPIPEADKICAYRVDGWWVVDTINKYQVNDLVIYCEVDSWIPHELAPFLSKGQEPREYNGVKGERLKTVKLRGQISQGLLLPIQMYNDYLGLEVSVFPPVGTDLTVALEIQKWEPPIPSQLQGMMRGNFPHFIPKTDQERCQNLRKAIFETHLNDVYEVTTKLDGSSMTVYVKDGEVGVCSRNIDLKETEGNSFWKAARDQNMVEALLQVCDVEKKEYAIQGELIGEGIQGNPEKLKGQKFYLFDVYDITNGCYLKPFERYGFLIRLYTCGTDLHHVPVIQEMMNVTDKFSTIDEILEFAEGPSLNPQTKREGLVFKSFSSNFTFKAISNSYLLKHKDR